MPGDTVSYRDHVVSVNGKPVEYREIGQYVGKGRGTDMTGATLAEEVLPGRPHPILKRDDLPFMVQGEGEWVVPAGIASTARWIVGASATSAASGATTARAFSPDRST